MRVKLKTLSPVHIGSGEEISPLEYLIDTKFMRLHMASLFNDLNFKPHMEKFISSSAIQRYIGNILPFDLLKKHVLYTVSLRGESKSYFKTTQTTVKSFTKTAGKVFIPGSSVKGSILSSVVWAVLKKTYTENNIVRLKRRGNEVTIPAQAFIKNSLGAGRGYQDLLDYVFAQFVKGSARNRFDSWLLVSDSNLFSPDEVLEVSLAKTEGSQRGSIPILYETIKPGTEFELEIKAQKDTLALSDIFETSNAFYQKVKEKTGEKFATSAKLLRIGQGSSAYSTSLLILAQELGISDYRVRPPRTTKLIDGTDSLGWVEVSYA